MINRILMELYDSYDIGDEKPLIDFACKTFPSDGTDKLFIGCCLILFDRCNGYKARYDCTRENLLDIVLSAKTNVENTNILKFYIERVNRKKGINKYLNPLINDQKLTKYVDLVIAYLEQFKPGFISEIKKYDQYTEYEYNKERK